MQNTRVRDVMSSPVVTVSPETPLPVAMALMKEHRIRHLPVLANGRLVGIVSRGDLRDCSSSAAINSDTYELNFMLSRLAVETIMTRKVFTITAEAFIVHAAELMTEKQIAGLPVIDQDGRLVGILTESDLLRLLARKLREGEQNGLLNGHRSYVDTAPGQPLTAGDPTLMVA
jgi:CBS domain-containing protein